MRGTGFSTLIQHFPERMNMSEFFTGSGDDGNTGLLGEGSVSKNNPVIEALGALDEVSAACGIARAFIKNKEVADVIIRIQRDLYKIMTEVAALPQNRDRFSSLSDEQIRYLEDRITWIGERMEIPRDFIIPGDDRGGAILDLARAIARRAERRMVDLFQIGGLSNSNILKYLNRLSSLLFMMELLELQSGDAGKITLAKE